MVLVPGAQEGFLHNPYLQKPGCLQKRPIFQKVSTKPAQINLVLVHAHQYHLRTCILRIRECISNDLRLTLHPQKIRM